MDPGQVFMHQVAPRNNPHALFRSLSLGLLCLCLSFYPPSVSLSFLSLSLSLSLSRAIRLVGELVAGTEQNLPE